MTVPYFSTLSEHPLFAGLQPSAVARLAGYAREISFPSGHLVLAEGAPAGDFYLLRKGKVALSTRSPGKGHLLVQTLEAGDTLGLSWLFPPYTWQFDARCLEPVEALVLDGTGLREELDSDPVLGYQILKRLCPVILVRLQQTRLRLLDIYGDNYHDAAGAPPGPAKTSGALSTRTPE